MEFLARELRRFITDNFLFGDSSGRFAFSDDDSLQERGIVDSTGILELVCHLQEKYAIRIEDEEIVPENLDSVARVVRFVEHKQRAAARDLHPTAQARAVGTTDLQPPAQVCAVGTPDLARAS
ncbi:MAG TPA: acyl carrier protein [Vicinamibacterales bacterium]|jgi:acyl carrier protein|nr:acyl carrier protein [Vicinamibacterales bacterium]